MTNILKKLLTLSGKGPEGKRKQNKLVKSLQEAAEKHINGDNSTITQQARVKLAMVVFPEVFEDYDETRQQVDPKVAKEWAIAMAHVIGLLVGTCVKRGRVDSAIKLLMEAAKDQAMLSSRAQEIVTGLKDPITKAQAEGHEPLSDEAKPETDKKPAKDHKLRMIEDLESQAALETSPEAKQALMSMAERMRKELELDNAA